jgi:hypothetical protein
MKHVENAVVRAMQEAIPKAIIVDNGKEYRCRSIEKAFVGFKPFFFKAYSFEKKLTREEL